MVTNVLLRGMPDLRRPPSAGKAALETLILTNLTAIAAPHLHSNWKEEYLDLA